MNMAVAEKGLIVFDLIIKGTASHAAHENNNNPIIKSIEVLKWIENLSFKNRNFLHYLYTLQKRTRNSIILKVHIFVLPDPKHYSTI